MLLARMLMPHSVTVAFADDLAMALANILHGLPILHTCLVTLELAACLAVHPGKCVIVPNFAKDHVAIKRFMVDKLAVWKDFRIDAHGKLLGFEIGPGAAEFRWKLAGEKFWTRGLAAKQGGDGISMGIRRYNLYAVSVLSHLSQLAEVPKAILDMEAKLLKGLTKGPWTAWTSKAILSLGDLGFKHEPRSVAEASLAARARAGLLSQAFLNGIALIDYEPPFDDEVRVFPLLPDWAEFTALLQIKKAIDAMGGICDLDAIRAQSELPPYRSLQSGFCAVLRHRRVHPWPDLLRTRLPRWIGAPSDDDIELVIANIRTAAESLPAFVVFATLKIILNGIVTSARMRGQASECIFCRQTEADRIEHLVHCPEVLLA
jgi:hypothetical protein